MSVAYDVFGKGKTVVRAGFGVFYDAFSQDFFTGQLAYNTDNTGPAYNPIGPNPVFITYNLNPALPTGTTGPLTGDTIIQPNVPIFAPASVTAGTATSTDAFTVAQNLRTPYVYNYNLNVQQEIAKIRLGSGLRRIGRPKAYPLCGHQPARPSADNRD